MSAASEADLIRVVLADANVLYSRVLRDYLLYAAYPEVLAVTWSSQILAAHRSAVESLKGATDESTVAALRRSGASRTAELIASLLGIE
jgi:hypothetical protein